MRKPFVAGNWKMNGSLLESESLLNNLIESLPKDIFSDIDVGIFPPFVYLDRLNQVRESKSQNIGLGAQDLSLHKKGAFTGQISADMLQDIGCAQVLVGHSERRQYCHEDDQVVAAKVEVALEAGLIPILCVGETQEQRDSKQTEQIISQQMTAVLERCSVSDLNHLVIAYEPIWAIGTGLTATPEQAQDVHSLIRSILAQKDQKLSSETTILYGGSVKASNCHDLFSMPDIDGGLIGGASLILEEFVQICLTAVRIARELA